MNNSNASKDDGHKVDINLCQKPKVEEQRNVDAKTVDEPPKIDEVALKMTQHFQGHKYVEQLRPDEKELMRELTENMALSRNSISNLKNGRQLTATTIKHIYNARYRLKKFSRGPRTEMQQLIKCLLEGIYLYTHGVLPDTEMLSDILWAPPDSVKLFHTFLTMLIMDLTYKTNKYRLPLVEFFGSTSIGNTYVVAFVFLTSEKEENFVWALQSVHNLLRCKEDVKVIVTDRDPTLMKAVNTIFPKCTALLCRYHIQINV
ncbi:hypothetical protein TSUD_127340 [Trifolium subterraneum]|nr:hypothetical protein TSUD_127340 [Trifolium subterraneum]